MKISLIAALSLNRVIGRQGQIPWHLPNDLKHFKAHTLNKPIIMGRKTWDEIGKPLPQRHNIVLTRQKTLGNHNIRLAQSLEQALELAGDAEEIMIVGGDDVYRQTIEHADRLYLTIVDTILEGDAFFPEWDPSKWTKVSEENHEPDERHQYAYHFQLWERLPV